MEGPVCTVLADIKSDMVVLSKGKLGQSILNNCAHYRTIHGGQDMETIEVSLNG